MQASDDKPYPLASINGAPQPKRAVSKKDFRLPRPYKRQLYSEEPARLTRLQVSLLGFAGLMVATLIAVLVLLADEKDRSPNGKPIVVAAADLEDLQPVQAQRTVFPAELAQSRSDVPPALRQLPVASVAPKAAIKAKPALRAMRRSRLPPALPSRPHALPPVLPPDPDVALIAAILLLTPAAPTPASVAPLSMELDRALWRYASPTPSMTAAARQCIR